MFMINKIPIEVGGYVLFEADVEAIGDIDFKLNKIPNTQELSVELNSKVCCIAFDGNQESLHAIVFQKDVADLTLEERKQEVYELVE